MKHYQKEFLLNYFFITREYAGWRNVAEKLIDKGRCIVAGNTRIWSGGIGNFLKIEPAKDAVDCSVYIFYLENFLSSEFFKDVCNSYIAEIATKKREIEQQYEELCEM